MKFIFPLLFLLLAILPVGAETLKFEADPICVASRLAEHTDSTKIASICEYYGYESQPSQDGYAIFRHSNGSLIRFSLSDGYNGKIYPTIEVKSKASLKEKDEILNDLKYQKHGNTYERRVIEYVIRCVPTSEGFLRFTTHPKSQ